jgi:drug/metabolite transporter (DMT)-like permease
VPVVSAVMFALYGLLTRYVARSDGTNTSFFWTGVTGMAFMTPLGLMHWQPMTAADWGWMATLCLTSAGAHWLMIKAYEVAEASAIQPFAYLQLMFIAVLGVTVFGETLRWNVVLGTVIVVAAGVFTLWRARLRERPSGSAVSGPSARP